jgi:regulator of protease activity HflC (stomatin/prohibitin superfamily)
MADKNLKASSGVNVKYVGLIPYILLVVGVASLIGMFFIGMIAMFVSAGCLIASLFIGVMNRNNSKGIVWMIVSGALLLVLTLSVVASLVSVPGGNVAVITNSPDSSLIGSTLNEGWHFDPVYALSEVEIIRYNTQTAEFVGDDYMADDDTGSIQVLSKDNLAIVLDFSITYNIPTDNVSHIRMAYGHDFSETIIKQAARSVPRDVCAGYNATEIIGDDRSIVERTIKEQITKAIESYGVDVVDVKLRDIRPPTSLMNAIESKKVAEQEVITAEYKKQKITIEAEANMTKVLIEADASAQARILNANGSAQAIRMVMDMLQGSNDTETINNYLTWLYIQALMDPNSNVSFVITDAGLLMTLNAGTETI